MPSFDATQKPLRARDAERTGNAVELRGVVRRFGARSVLDGIDLTLRASEFVAVLGPSGTGKTTLLRLLAGLDRADGGTVKVDSARSVVFQEPRLVLARKVWENVVLGDRSADARLKNTMIMITHDVDEAILLSDRILVLSQGRVCLDVQVALPKPRHKAGSEFDALRTRLLAELGVVVPPAPEVSGHYGAAPVALAA